MRTLLTIETGRLVGVTRKLPREERRIQERVNRTMRMLDASSQATFKEMAPADTGALRDSVRSSILFRGNVVRISVRARAQRDGFDYLPVTRFGHIRPVIRSSRPGKRAYLKVHVNGRHSSPVLKRSVRGHHPATDWVDQAGRIVSVQVRAASRTLARELQVMVIR